MSLLTISPIQMLSIWADLVECQYGKNGYGSYVAEIYLHRVMPMDRYRDDAPESEHAREAYVEANRALYDLCRLFEQERNVELFLWDGPSSRGEEWPTPLPLDALITDPQNPWRHRVHIGTQKVDRLA